MAGDYRDFVIEELAAEVAQLEEAKRQLVDLVADLTFDYSCLRLVADRAFTHPYQRRRDRDDVITKGRAA
jgi:hypothetical protein